MPRLLLAPVLASRGSLRFAPSDRVSLRSSLVVAFGLMPRLLIASVQAALTDSDAERLRHDLMERVSRYRAHGIIVDVTAIDVMDSFAARSLRTIGHMTRLRGADTVIVGL